MRLDSDADRREMYEMGAKLIGWDQRRPTGAQNSALRRGIGVAAGDWPRFPAVTEAELLINRDGSVEARTGTQDIGTGQRTVMGVIAATTLGIPLEYVSVSIGSSSWPIGPGSGGSMTAHNTAPPMTDA